MINLVKKALVKFRDSESGATLVEYGVAITLAIVLGVGALTTLAGNVGAAMDNAGGSMCTGEADQPAACAPEAGDGG